MASVIETAGTTFTCPAMTTDEANAMVVHLVGLDADSNNTTTALSGATNANLTSLTIRHQQTASTQTGGGIGCITGFKASGGSTGTTTGSSALSAVKTYITFALKPGATVYSESCTIAQAQTLNAVGIFTGFGSGSISQAQTLNALGKVGMLGSAVVDQEYTIQTVWQLLLKKFSSTVNKAFVHKATSVFPNTNSVVAHLTNNDTEGVFLPVNETEGVIKWKS
jgi:hypothetical protein